MSDLIPFIDLTTAVVGTTGTIQLPLAGMTGNQPSHLRIFNESGCGLQIQFNDGSDDYVPAGAWPVYELGNSVTQMSWQVTYVIPNAPINQLQLIYYYPGENVPAQPTLGNSPIGITGSVTTGGSTLSNEGNPSGTEVIDIGDSALAKLWDIFTDHFTISVDQGGVLHAALKGNSSGNALQIGQAGDTSEVLGSLSVDQLLSVSTADIETITSSGDLNVNVPAANTQKFNVGGAEIFAINGNGPKVEAGSAMQWPGGTITNIAVGYNASVTGTINLSFSPSQVFINCNISQPGSATIGSSISGSSFTAHVGAGNGFWWMAIQA
ncbi:MAG: hypothetical protein ACRETA_04510 [Gammaproteobacteria bacterium]